MNKLVENLGLPQIDGQIVAMSERRLNLLTDEYENVFSWKVILTVPGYDRRYNPGVAYVFADDIQKMIQALETILPKINILESEPFSGTYSEQFGDLKNPLLELEARNERVWVNFNIKSNTGYRFLRSLSPDEVVVAVDKLKSALKKKQQMLATLRALL